MNEEFEGNYLITFENDNDERVYGLLVAQVSTEYDAYDYEMYQLDLGTMEAKEFDGGFAMYDDEPPESIIKFIGKISKRLINNKFYSLILTPGNKAQKVLFRNVVTTWVVRVNHNKVSDTLISKE